jgi:hypothetical protein
MDSDLERAVASLAVLWDDEAPPITVAEIRSATVAHVPSAIGDDLRSSRRSWTMMLTAAAALLVLVVGLLAMTRADDSPAPPTDSSPITSAPTPDTTTPEPTTVTSIPDTTTATSEPDESSTSIPSRFESSPEVADVQRQQIEALRTLPGFRATVVRTRRSGTATTPESDIPGRSGTYELTMLADGRRWAEGRTDADDEWFSFEPVGGIFRGAARQPDGTVLHFEITGIGTQAYSIPTPLGLIFPDRPFANSNLPGQDVEEIEHDGRPAWRITTTLDGPSSPGPFDTTVESIQIIDRASGLTVLRSQRSTSNPDLDSDGVGDGQQVSVQEIELLDLEVVTELPADFPERFPDPSAVARRAEDAGALLRSFDEAAAVYGDGFVVPGDAKPDQLPSVFSSQLFVDEDVQLTSVEIVWTFGSAFVPDRVILTKLRGGDGSAPPEDFYRPYADGFCMAFGGGECADTYDRGAVERGALSGSPIGGGPPADQARVLGPGGEILLESSSPERLTELMNTFVTWP